MTKEERFTALLKKHKGVVYSVLLKNIHNKDHHDDLYQDIVLRAWEAYDSFKGISQFSSWLHRIAYNTTIDKLRRLQAQANRIARYNWFYEYTASAIDDPYHELHLPVIDTLSEN